MIFVEPSRAGHLDYSAEPTRRTTNEHREPITKQIGEEAECAGSGVDY
jgi:hypothetical protein